MPDVQRLQRVLVVDDDPDVRESVQELLGAHLPDVDIVAASNAEQALRTMSSTSIDLLVTDYQMPGLTGFDLLASVRNATPGIPTIVMTAYADLELAVAAMNEHHAQRFLPKPFDPEELVRIVRELLIERRATELRDEILRQALAGGEEA